MVVIENIESCDKDYIANSFNKLFTNAKIILASTKLFVNYLTEFYHRRPQVRAFYESRDRPRPGPSLPPSPCVKGNSMSQQGVKNNGMVRHI